MTNTQRQPKQLMKTPLRRLLFWTPRILCLLFAAFISLFATGVFDEGYGGWKTALALLIHLIPTWIVLAVLFLAWRREWVGGLIFVALGAAYLILAWGRFHWSAYLSISGPLFLIGVLFSLSWLYRRELRVTT
jgi:hypothetical protein